MPSSSKRSYESGSDEEVYQPVKRSKAVAATDATMDASTILKLSKTKLEKMDHTELVNAIIVLQQQAKQSGGVTTLSDKQIEEKAELARKAMKGIKAMMTWKPSAKNGGAKFSYSAVVPQAAIFYKLFSLEGWKGKMKKLTKQEFENAAEEDIQSKVRYDYLNITGANVTLRWNTETSEFTVSGTYGLGL